MDASDRPQAYGGYGPMNVKFVWSMIGLYTIILGIRTYISLRIVRGGGQLSLVLAYVAWVSVKINDESRLWMETLVPSEKLDATYNMWPMYFWSSAEMWTILIVSSLPPLWPLVQRRLEVIQAYSRQSCQSRRQSSALLAFRHKSRTKRESNTLQGEGSGSQNSHPFERLEEDAGFDVEGIHMKRTVTVRHEPKENGEDGEIAGPYSSDWDSSAKVNAQAHIST
ncbi:MAG: hypothetical protein Q9162_004867 [Coniocarpon cinnabarinum]